MKLNQARMSDTLLEEVVFLKCNDCWRYDCIGCRLCVILYWTFCYSVNYSDVLFLYAFDSTGLCLTRHLWSWPWSPPGTLWSHCVMALLTRLSKCLLYRSDSVGPLGPCIVHVEWQWSCFDWWSGWQKHSLQRRSLAAWHVSVVLCFVHISLGQLDC